MLDRTASIRNHYSRKKKHEDDLDRPSQPLIMM